MKVSILTVCYNSALTIQDTIESVLKQTYNDIEYIIIDGASIDDTLNIINRYKDQISKIISEPDNGIYDAMNKGLALATGEIIGILNADDFFASHTTVSDIVNTLKSSGADSLYGNLNYVDGNNLNKIVRKWVAGNYSLSSFRWGWMPPHPTFFVRRKVYEQYGTFRLDLKSAADYELMLRFLFVNNISTAYLPKVLVHMRTGGVSNASFTNRLSANRQDRLAWKLNGVKPFFFTLFLKPVRKIFQFI